MDSDAGSVVTADEVSLWDDNEVATAQTHSTQEGCGLEARLDESEKANRRLVKKVAALERENAELRAFYVKHTGGVLPGAVDKPPVSLHKPAGDSMRRLRRSLVPPPSPSTMEKLTDSMMSELAASAPFLPIKKIAPQTYTLDTPHKKHKVTVHSGALVVRLGCGYEDVLTFLEKRAKIIRNRGRRT